MSYTYLSFYSYFFVSALKLNMMSISIKTFTLTVYYRLKKREPATHRLY